MYVHSGGDALACVHECVRACVFDALTVTGEASTHLPG